MFPSGYRAVYSRDTAHVDSACPSVVVGSTMVVMLAGWAAPGLVGFEVMPHKVPMGS